VADSADTEVFLVTRQHFSYLAEGVQRELTQRLANLFAYEQPYERSEVERIKDKFREWDKFKMDTQLSFLKESYMRGKQEHALSSKK